MNNPDTQNPDPRHHVVVVGGGFGGLQCIKSLKSANTRITLIDQRNHHLFQPLLYQVATTILAPSEIAWPLRQIFRNRPDVTTLLARVTGVQTDRKQVQLDDGSEVSYDTLVLATGARHSYFGNGDWEDHAPGLKTLEDATRIRRKILSAFEAAETANDPIKQQAHLTFAVIGAGPTGVELAGIIAELAYRILPREFRNIDTSKARVLLVEAGPSVLPAFPETLSTYTKDQLAKLGVEVALVPGIAPGAKQMGAYAANVIKSRLTNQTPPDAFAYKDFGSMATLGRRAAIADFGKFKMKGALAWWVWGVAHIFFLIGTRSRIAVAWSWFWSFMTGQNSARIITVPDHRK